MEKRCQYCRKKFIENSASIGNVCSESCYNKKQQYRINYQERAREKVLNNKFGITVEEYDKLYLQQKGRCGICEKHQSEFKRRFAVDHNHDTGQVRGLLCGNCNTGIGNLRDSIKLLKKAIKYLK
jgi:hypothetical protein